MGKARLVRVLLLIIAIGARVIYGLLAPLLPFLGAVVVLSVVYMVIFRGCSYRPQAIPPTLLACAAFGC